MEEDEHSPPLPEEEDEDAEEAEEEHPPSAADEEEYEADNDGERECEGDLDGMVESSLYSCCTASPLDEVHSRSERVNQLSYTSIRTTSYRVIWLALYHQSLSTDCMVYINKFDARCRPVSVKIKKARPAENSEKVEKAKKGEAMQGRST